jgi:4a-hydroxytetrahydrobiopterin dehydratase
MTTLDAKQLNKLLDKLEGWSVKDSQLQKKFAFADFIETFGFMAKVALLAERLQHHPDWEGGYNNVTIRLSTHDAGGITQKDIDLANAIEKLLSTSTPKR